MDSRTGDGTRPVARAVAGAPPAPVRIEDPADDRLLPYRDLSDAELRRRVELGGGYFVVEGKVAVAQLLRSGLQVDSLLVDTRRLAGAADLVAGVLAALAPVYVASHHVVAATVGFNLHRGIVAVARRPVPADPATVVDRAATWRGRDGGRPLVAVLEGLNDHENLGALFRNAGGFAVAAVLLDPTCADPLYRRAVRVSSGQVLRVPFARFAAWPAGLAAVRDAGFTVVALSPRTSGGRGPAADARHRAVPLGDWARSAGDGPVAVLLGAEGPGLTPVAMEAADVVVSIPMAPGVDSLNVATAAAVAFYELSGGSGRGPSPTMA